jgi:hypothetical protein
MPELCPQYFPSRMHGSHVSTCTWLPYFHVSRAGFTNNRAHFSPFYQRITRIAVVTGVLYCTVPRNVPPFIYLVQFSPLYHWPSILTSVPNCNLVPTSVLFSRDRSRNRSLTFCSILEQTVCPATSAIVGEVFRHMSLQDVRKSYPETFYLNYT